MECLIIDDNMLNQYSNRTLEPKVYSFVRDHLDECDVCWDKWNKFRWDKASNNESYEELKEYLGTDFIHGLDSSWALANEWYKRNPTTNDEIESFYIGTQYYLYNLMIWQASGNRPDYVQEAEQILKKMGCKRVLDFGCGIGNDGLQLISKGYEIFFYDICTANICYLCWRLEHRKLNAVILDSYHQLRGLEIDTLWAMDVIEHLPDPYTTLSSWLKYVRVIVFDSFHTGQSAGRQPFHYHHESKSINKFLKTEGFKQVINNNSLNIWSK